MPFLDGIAEPFVVELRQRQTWSIFKGTHFHNCYELYYLAEGEVTYFVEDTIYPVKAGEMILIPPATIHKTMPCGDIRHKRILVYISSDFLIEFLALNPDLFACFAHTKIRTLKRERIEQLLHALLEEAKELKDLVMVKALLGELLTLLNRWSKHMESPETVRSGSASSEKILEIVRYINGTYSEDITLTHLPRRFYINPTYLSRKFKQVMGVSYSEYLTKIRMRAALHLLANTRKKVSQIAQEVGFRSDNHFCKMFRQVMGMSPLAYRKSNIV
mgnify:CR=1 FL=1